MAVIDMQFMRYLNLFERIAKVRTNRCFKYNETIYFCVPAAIVSRAIGKNAINAKKLNEVLGKKIKIIPLPQGVEDAQRFIQSIVEPVVFKEVSVNEEDITLSASTQSKAALIGRNKRRLLEMQKIIRDFFHKEFRIV